MTNHEADAAIRAAVIVLGAANHDAGRLVDAVKVKTEAARQKGREEGRLEGMPSVAEERAVHLLYAFNAGKPPAPTVMEVDLAAVLQALLREHQALRHDRYIVQRVLNHYGDARDLYRDLVVRDSAERDGAKASVDPLKPQA